MDPETTRVAVAIVTHDSAEVLPDCFGALPAAMADVAQYQIVVADSASTDHSVKRVTELAPEATVVELPVNAGYAAGINAAAAAASDFDALLVLNPDVRLGPGSVASLLRALAIPGTGIATPKIRDESGRLELSLRREPTVRRALGEALLGGQRASRYAMLGEVVGARGRYDKSCTADWATGAAMLVSRACLDAVGPWDESFFLYSEETDFSLRARDAGFALRYVPEAEVVHLGGSSKTSSRLWTILTLNRVELFRRRHGGARTLAFAFAVALNEALRAGAGGSTHRAALLALVFPARRPPEVKYRRGTRVTERGPGRPSEGNGDATGFICFSAQDWWYFNRAHSDFQLMQRVAQRRKVLLINSIGMRMPLPGRSSQPLRRILRKASSVSKMLRRPVPSLPDFWVFTPLMLPFYGVPWVRPMNACLVRLQVALVARRAGIGTPILFVTIPTAWEVARKMRRRALVFNRSDKHSAFGEADREFIEELEAKLLRHSDVVLYVSGALMAEEAELTGARSHFLDHGVDIDHFRAAPAEDEPSDLREIPHPRVGFIGGLRDYTVDFDLLEKVARDLPEAQLVLVGDATCSMKRFEALDNVHWLGYRRYEEIPSYGRGLDVALMPWLRNDWIRYANPIKLKEYLALGLPVITTDFPEAHRYESWITITTDADDFIAAVRQAVTHGSPSNAAERRASVAGASWGRRAEELIGLCDRVTLSASAPSR